LESPTEVLGRYIADADFSDFPEAVINKAKLCILDSIGCIIGGYASEPGRKVADLMRDLDGHDATILGSSTKAALPNAALANTYMANILDYDDTYHGHPGCTIIPPALAGAEMMGASGKDLLTAVIVGYEVHSRVARAMYERPETLDKISGVACQTFGSAASASKILSLPANGILDALGIAGATAPVQSNSKTGGAENVPPTMKVGFYACSSVGTTSALMAMRKIDGPHNILDGDTGFWRMIGADGCEFAELTRELGQEYEILNVAFKPYSCCRWFHSSLDALLSMTQEHGVTIENVRKVKAETMGGKRDLEYMKNPHPANFVAAEFSLPYCLAVSLSGLKPGPDWISDKAIGDRVILSTAAKSECSFLRKSTATRSADEVHKWPATVELALNDGSTFSKSVEYPKGCPRNKLIDEELTAKFVRLASHVIREENARMIVDLIDRLEKMEVRELIDLIGDGHR
jgi:2-methylcitrate dehydratase PrpD